MNTTTTPVTSSKHHPMFIAAAIGILLFCCVGIAAIMGWIPSSIGGNAATVVAQEPLPVLPQAIPQTAPAYVQAKPPVRPVQQLAQADVPAKPAWCGNCGNVESTRVINHRAQGSGVGAAGGAVLGGLLGNQIGDGRGRQLATVAGAVGGAVVGNHVEGNMNATRSYETRVRLDDGSVRTFNNQSDAGWRTGQRVKIVNGSLRSAN
jgi:outer membrane lipoprotein SlyB